MKRNRSAALPTGAVIPTEDQRHRVTWHLADGVSVVTDQTGDGNMSLPLLDGPDTHSTDFDGSVRALLDDLKDTTGETRLPELTEDTVRRLAHGLDDIAEWYTLEFRAAGGRLAPGDRKRKAKLEATYGRPFLRRWTRLPLDGDVRAVYPVNFWHLQGKIKALKWLLGHSLTRSVSVMAWKSNLD